MAVAYIGNSSVTANVASGNVTIGFPASAVNGDILVAAIACRNTETIVANTANGWVTMHSQFATANNATLARSGHGALYTAYYIYQGTTPDLIFYRTNGDAGIGSIMILRGVNYSSPKGNTSLLDNGNTTTPNTGTITVGASGFLTLILAGGSDTSCSGQNAASEPVATGWTERMDVACTLGSDTTLMVASATKNTAGGATGTLNITTVDPGYHIVEVTEWHPASTPGQTTGLGAIANTDGKMDLAWTAPASDGGSPVSGYRIERESPIGGGFSDLVANTATNAVTYKDTAVLSLTEYNYRVTAINYAGQGTVSATAANTTLTGDIGALTGAMMGPPYY